MKWIAFLLVAIMCITQSAMSQTIQYSTQTTGGAPTPISPTSPDTLGLQAPSVTSSQQVPTPQEKSQGLIKADQQVAYSASYGLGATATSPTYQMIVPPSGIGTAPNNLYISYAPQIGVSCNLYANLPMWLHTSGTGDIWFYEWYPDGMLYNNYAGIIDSPGWYKRWFLADIPGWHILQYYCNGWSNFAYIYIYGPNGGWISPVSNPEPTPYPIPPENPDKLKCEQNSWCSWVNGRYLCEGFIPSNNPEKQRCEQKPYCSWVNGKCLCTGLNPPATDWQGLENLK